MEDAIVVSSSGFSLSRQSIVKVLQWWKVGIDMGSGFVSGEVLIRQQMVKQQTDSTFTLYAITQNRENLKMAFVDCPYM
ncbi:LOW QUALITY PROTEIN: hypothetical protein CsSME_00014131 [Camellia sinensis var. sinensis]